MKETTPVDLERLEKGIQKALNLHEVQNIMNKYESKLTRGLHKEVEQLFALKTPGVRVERSWGAYEGEAGVKRLYSGLHRHFMGDKPTRIGDLVANGEREISG